MNYKAAIEAILFTMGESVELGRIADAIQLNEKETKKLLDELIKEYRSSSNIGMNIIELDGAYQMCTKPQMYEYLIRIAKQPKKRVLTDVLLETLSIIAYKQPVTKAEIEKIRGVSSEHAISKLVEYNLVQELGREPLPEEIAKEMDTSVDRVREIMKIAQEPVSLETPIGEEEDSHLGDFIEDHDAPAPADAASFTLLREQLEEVLETLTIREKRVLELRFGLEDGRSRTLEEVGQHFGVTRERIRQIEAKSLRKLRHPSRIKKLKDFLE